MNIGNVPSAPITAPPLQSSTLPLASHTPSVIPSSLPKLHSASPLPTSFNPLLPILDAQESNNSGSRATNLLKPSFFSPPSSLLMPPITSSVPTAPPLHPPVTMQRPYGTPLLQPFPPPAPPPSLTPVPSGPIITKEKVRDALSRLVQNNQFIDMVYREMLNAHNS
ncbi:mRNA-decapping enzyme-like protein isoform X2 [Iris pallida]|uniref:mRNA-decapping enzyme-like protein isoform X2 n=1 Tax=Iris pallida TaxID=29817 RepID=A0AAX6EBV1_IRIPA|nr:mRNA-decapping enzyme-like protein isoform X2 [Iris pallida]